MHVIDGESDRPTEACIENYVLELWILYQLRNVVLQVEAKTVLVLRNQVPHSEGTAENTRIEKASSHALKGVNGPEVTTLLQRLRF